MMIFHRLCFIVLASSVCLQPRCSVWTAANDDLVSSVDWLTRSWVCTWSLKLLFITMHFLRTFLWNFIRVATCFTISICLVFSVPIFPQMPKVGDTDIWEESLYRPKQNQCISGALALLGTWAPAPRAAALALQMWPCPAWSYPNLIPYSLCALVLGISPIIPSQNLSSIWPGCGFVVCVCLLL